MSTTPASNSIQPTITTPRLVLLARDIKLSHSVFAMPFALLAAYWAAGFEGRVLHHQPWTVVLIVVCMVFARTVAMTMNRLADRRLDADNPRTLGRAIPSGRLSVGYVVLVTILCAAGFVAATAGFWWIAGNPWPLILSPLVLAWVSLYSYTKRFTWLCHLFLGSALAMSPVAAVIAVAPEGLRDATPWLLAGMVMCWVAGFDVIYALQDVDTDRAQGLFSMPSRLGVSRALWISRGLHLLAVAALVVMAARSPLLGVGFTVGVVVVVALLTLEHVLVHRSHTHHIHVAFFTLNGLISLLLGGLGIADILLSV